MKLAEKFLVGTSGFSFDDWVGGFYPPGTRKQDMFAHYVRHFPTVEVNYTFYRMPSPRTMERLARTAPPGYLFWVKANRSLTHEGDLAGTPAFLDALAPLAGSGRLAGVLLQFPQSFRRTVAARKFLAAALEGLSPAPRAVEFRHRSWEHPSTAEGLRQCGVTLVIPDVPPIAGLYRAPPALTTSTGYLRLHSRNAAKWYAGAVERYDYSYGDVELRDLVDQWSPLAERAEKVFAFFNNCHGGQAAANAEAFRRLLEQIDAAAP